MFGFRKVWLERLESVKVNREYYLDVSIIVDDPHKAERITTRAKLPISEPSICIKETSFPYSKFHTTIDLGFGELECPNGYRSETIEMKNPELTIEEAERRLGCKIRR